MVYGIVLVLHSVLRWVVLAAALGAVGQAAASLATGGAFARRHKLANLAFLISMDVQLLLGIVLYAVLSPFTQAAFADFGAAMKDGTLRFWAVEHLTGMVIAVVLMHVGYALAKRSKSARGKHLHALIWFGLSLLAVLGSIPWVARGVIPAWPG